MSVTEIKISSKNEKGRGKITIGENWLEIYTPSGKATKRIKIDVKEFAKCIDNWIESPKTNRGFFLAQEFIKSKDYDTEVAFIWDSGKPPCLGTLRVMIFWHNPRKMRGVKGELLMKGYTLNFPLKKIRESLAFLLSE